ncbi:chymotrypsinogen B-like [Anticarsia gemmatalis]|uniref:chymotrypsinogen B-like n=1 Tax=Anticarsia gemmatalis TaxID=129554 RepID=UPI003F76EA57
MYLLAILHKICGIKLEGPPKTIYRPCGVGLLHFEKISENEWEGVLDFERYKYYAKVDIVIRFKEETSIHVASLATVTAKRTDKYDLIIQATRPVPKECVFTLKQNNLNKNQSDVPTITLLTLNNVKLCNEKIKATQLIALGINQKPIAGSSYLCGRTSPDHDVMSLRADAEAGDWPWHVALAVKDVVPVHKCGGNIISWTAVLTAGSCVFEKEVQLEINDIIIIAGSSNLKSADQTERQELDAKEIILHPAYNSGYATSDLAIIRVEGFQFNQFVQPICVLGPIYDKTDFYGKEAILVGFGNNNINSSKALKATDLMMQNDSTCIGQAPRIYKEHLNEFTFCAGYGPTSSLNAERGDGGGGLVISTSQFDDKISWFLRGLFSKCVQDGASQCNTKYYSIYTDVPPHHAWIFHHSGLKLMGYGVIVP